MEKICQCCGMPLREEKEFGTNLDGTKSEDYCVYCYKNGTFTQDCTMEDMIEHCLPFAEAYQKQAGIPFDKEEERRKMQQFFPTLKRWKK